MTDRERMVVLSAFSVTSLAFAGSWGLVTRPKPTPAPAPAPVALASTAPAPGLTPAPSAPRRKVVVVRRSRAS